ncbi:ATP-binding protein [Ferdinandcohnia sp. Marseille-Q9671]
MIKDYLIEKRSWILFFFFLQGLLLLIGYLDPAISFQSVLYIFFLSIVLFLVFLSIRYTREISFYKSLKEWDPNVDVERIQEGSSPYERMIEKAVKQQIEFYKQEINRHSTSVEQEKDELLSWIHEVKTPLTTMQLMIGRIEDRVLKDQLMYEWLRVHLLLDQQLHQRRIPFMENDLYIEKVDLEKLLMEEIKSLRSWCLQKGVGFDVAIQNSEVLSDEKWLHFIIRQIVTNAVKYSQDSDIEIRSYEKNGNIILEIQDYGRGIKAKDIPRIFEKGFTSTSNHKDHAATGMGLYLAKKASIPLKIRFDVQSTYGEGTRFTLIFPRKNDFTELTSM